MEVNVNLSVHQNGVLIINGVLSNASASMHFGLADCCQLSDGMSLEYRSFWIGIEKKHFFYFSLPSKYKSLQRVELEYSYCSELEKQTNWLKRVSKSGWHQDWRASAGDAFSLSL